MLELVIPDTGPLITFALIDRLDLIDRFDCAIVLTDQVLDEVTRGPSSAPDRPALEAWLSRRGNRVQTVETVVGTLYRGAPRELRAKVRSRDVGEQAVRELADKVRNSLPPDGQCLVLFEDDAVKRMTFGEHVHLLHTYAFMISLERLGVVPSAETLFQAVLGRGRNLARDPYERRASRDGVPQPWTDRYRTDPDGAV